MWETTHEKKNKSTMMTLGWFTPQPGSLLLTSCCSPKHNNYCLLTQLGCSRRTRNTWTGWLNLRKTLSSFTQTEDLDVFIFSTPKGNCVNKTMCLKFVHVCVAHIKDKEGGLCCGAQFISTKKTYGNNWSLFMLLLWLNMFKILG